MSLKSINPYTNSLIKEYQEYSLDKINEILESCNARFLEYRKTSFQKRAQLLNSVAKVLRENRDEYARSITLEMGKPITESQAEVEKCAWVCEYYAQNGKEFLKDEIVDMKDNGTDGVEAKIIFEPLGVVLAIMPWNFPFWQVFRFAAPTLMAGNVGILKHASNVSGCALIIEEIFRKAGFDKDCFRTLLISSDKVEHVIESQYVKAVTLTGSEYAGSKVAQIAGKNLKKVVLELGGSDPFVVLEDADLKEAASIAVKARFLNGGQSCIAAKRFIVDEKVFDQFMIEVKANISKLKSGDPMLEETHIGPQARLDLAEGLEEQLNRAKLENVEVLYGGNRKECYFEPTLAHDPDGLTLLFRDEVFGPIMVVTKSRDREHALHIANNTQYGLGASIWTKSKDNIKYFAESIEAGSVFFNEMVKSDPRLPFGGIKKSGYGRELSGYGIREFVNIKTIYVK